MDSPGDGRLLTADGSLVTGQWLRNEPEAFPQVNNFAIIESGG